MTVIKSSDPQAIEKLNAKIERLENLQSDMKRANAHFKWAPSVGAWQRALNDNARYALKRIADVA